MREKFGNINSVKYFCGVIFKSMGITDRKQREKEEKRLLIIETAKRLFRENGFERVSLRNIADAIEYSPTMIYLYFKDKDELLHVLHIEGFRMLHTAFENAVANIQDAWQRLDVLGEAYLRFAIENPEYYELMFISSNPMKIYMTDEVWEEGLKSHSILENEVKNCIAHGYFKGLEYRTVAFMIWCFVHGLASLIIKDRLKMYEEVERPVLIANTHKQLLGFLQKL